MIPKSPPDITVFDIAHWFLGKANSEGKRLKHMKLQKLVYFAYGWYYAYFDQPLFPETLFAWRHGPVVADLYGRFKRFGGNAIEHTEQPPDIDNNTLSILEDVWNNYSPKTDIELSRITHRINAPWANVYSECRWGAMIQPAEIRDYFKGLMKKYEK